MTGPWVGRPATEIAAAVREGRVTASEVVEQHLAHIARVDGRVGAFELVDVEGARTGAARIDADPERGSLPLAGVPVGIKDNADVAGLASRHGSAASPDRPAEADSELVTRLREAGAVVVGKTRMPELALATVSDNAFGVARNPWDLTRISGGSSGGSAAALASAAVPIALGSDGGGSIRVPSAACGTVGIKPGSGTLPPRSSHPHAAWCGVSQFGPMATTVADLALMLDVLSAHGAGADLATSIAGLRIATSDVAAVPFGSVTPEPAVHAGWTTAIGTLATQGAIVTTDTPDYPSYLGRAMATRSFLGARHDVERTNIDRRRLGPRARTVLRLAPVAERLAPLRHQDADVWKATADAFFEQYDVLVTPATAGTAYPHRDWHHKGLIRTSRPSLRLAAYTSPWNLADLPAAAVPMGLAPDGLPVAVQIVGGRGREDLVLSVAACLERCHPWARHAPGWLDEVDERIAAER